MQITAKKEPQQLQLQKIIDHRVVMSITRMDHKCIYSFYCCKDLDPWFPNPGYLPPFTSLVYKQQGCDAGACSLCCHPCTCLSAPVRKLSCVAFFFSSGSPYQLPCHSCSACLCRCLCPSPSFFFKLTSAFIYFCFLSEIFLKYQV